MALHRRVGGTSTEASVSNGEISAEMPPSFNVTVMVREVAKNLLKQEEPLSMNALVRECECFTLQPTDKVCRGLAAILQLTRSDIFAVDFGGGGGGGGGPSLALTDMGRDRFSVPAQVSDFPGVEDGVSHPMLARAFLLRRAVFVNESGYSMAEEFDSKDRSPGVRHFMAVGGGNDLGTARAVVLGSGEDADDDDGGAYRKVAKAERLCVVEAMRGFGVGRALLEAVEGWARGQGCDCVTLNAFRAERGYYEKRGFAAYGEPFDEAAGGSFIPHLKMRKSLLADGEASVVAAAEVTPPEIS